MKRDAIADARKLFLSTSVAIGAVVTLLFIQTSTYILSIPKLHKVTTIVHIYAEFGPIFA